MAESTSDSTLPKRCQAATENRHRPYVHDLAVLLGTQQSVLVLDLAATFDIAAELARQYVACKSRYALSGWLIVLQASITFFSSLFVSEIVYSQNPLCILVRVLLRLLLLQFTAILCQHDRVVFRVEVVQVPLQIRLCFRDTQATEALQLLLTWTSILQRGPEHLQQAEQGGS